MKSDAQKKQELIVILVAVCMILVSVVTTVYFSDVIFDAMDGDAAGPYQHVTFTDAVIKCQESIKGEYKNKLTQVTMDDHSSRFDQSANKFKLFFRAQKNAGSAEDASDFYISCLVSARSGRVVDMEGAEHKTSPTEALREDDGGLFGWPR